ncbi:MAG: glycosyltransferase family 9 protein [bacterium]
MQSVPRKILFIKVSAVGDILRAVPALIAVRKHFPAAHIAWMIGEEYLEIIEHCPHIQEIIPYRRRKNLEDLSGFVKFILGIRKRNFDLVINLQNTKRFDLIGRLSGAGFRTPVVNFPQPVSGLEGVFEIIRRAGIDACDEKFELWATPEDREFAERFLERHNIAPNERVVGINPGTNWETKQWKLENYTEVANKLVDSFGVKILIFGSDAERNRAEKIACMMRTKPTIAAGETTLRQAGCLIERCCLFITNDSGLMHFASLSGVQTAAIFGATDPQSDGPTGSGHLVFSSKSVCPPCYKSVCRLKNNQLICLRSIMPEHVFEKLTEHIKEKLNG